MRATTAVVADGTITFCIAADHPALPGHFPDAPVVPGVLLLAEGLRRLEMLVAAPIQCRRIESAKFLQPVEAGAAVTAKLSLVERGQSSVVFFVAGTLVAHVKFLVAAPSGLHKHE